MSTATEGSPCPYCQAPVTFRPSSAFIYNNGKDYGAVYACTRYPACDAFVGVHKGTTQALGRLANHELRYWKKRAHAAFDPLWQARWSEQGGPKVKARGGTYCWLAEQLGIEPRDCHVGMFDVTMCKRVVEVCAPHCQRLARGELLGRLPRREAAQEGVVHGVQAV